MFLFTYNIYSYRLFMLYISNKEKIFFNFPNNYLLPILYYYTSSLVVFYKEIITSIFVHISNCLYNPHEISVHNEEYPQKKQI